MMTGVPSGSSRIATCISNWSGLLWIEVAFFLFCASNWWYILCVVIVDVFAIFEKSIRNSF